MDSSSVCSSDKFLHLVLVQPSAMWPQPTLVHLWGRALFIFRSKLFISLCIVGGVGQVLVSTGCIVTRLWVCTQHRVKCSFKMKSPRVRDILKATLHRA